jgi:hypothetical protein
MHEECGSFPVMPITFRNAFLAGAIVAVIGGVYLLQLWRPERQIRLHTAHLIRQIERRNWTRVGGFLAADYRDDWNPDSERLLERLRFLLGFTNDLQIRAVNPQIESAVGAGRWRSRVEMHGSGEVMAFAQERINALDAPFVLEWRQESWRPWDWRLVRASNTALKLGGWGG